jgi:cytoskeletal protein CcmA (bactofilin family)
LPSTQRDLTNLFVSESYYRLLQTDPVDDSTLLDGTGSLVTLLAVSGTVDAYYFKGDGSQLTNLSPASMPAGTVSSSTQTLSHLSGTNIISGSAQRGVLGLATTDSPTFNNLTLTGDLTARQLIISSSVINVTQSFSSGSTIFGNDILDTHQFTGSVFVSGSVYGRFVGDGSGLTNLVAAGTISSSNQIAEFGFITSSDWNYIVNKPDGIVSSSFQVLNGTGIISSSDQRSSIGLGTTDNVVFGNISGSNLTIDGNAFIDGTLTARTYIISSSIVDIQSIKASGSTQFGDTIDDTHQFTGSLFLSGSLTSQGTINAPFFSGTFGGGVISSSQQIQDLGFVTDGELSGSVYWDNILNKPNGIVSSSAQTLSHLFGTNIISGSGQRGVLGLAETDSPRFNTLYATNGNFDGNLLVGGTITARTYVVSSSVVNYQTLLVSGSSRFGDTLDDKHQFTGSMTVTGSATINGDTTLSGDLLVFTGSAYMSGSLNVEGRFVLPSINQLPALDSTGSLVISGSNLYLFI